LLLLYLLFNNQTKKWFVERVNAHFSFELLLIEKETNQKPD